MIRRRSPPPSTVVAAATPPGRSALALVRWSGPSAEAIARRLAPSLPNDWAARTPRLVTLVDAAQRPLDSGLITLFRSPRSYTGEDLVEFSGHGNPQIVARVVAAAVAAGATPAEPGELTMRAFFSGRIDLVGAEAVADLVEARSELGARLALERLSGGGERFEPLRERLLSILAEVDAGIDFAESDGVPAATAGVAEVRRDLETRLATAERLARAAEPTTLALVGAQNAGKSTLFNALLGRDRALVSAIPGTTRDLLRETLERRGRAIELLDTPGFAEEARGLDRLAIERAAAAIEHADLLLVVVGPASGSPAERLAEGRARLAGRRGLVVLSQADRDPGLIAPPGTVAVSALTGAGWSNLERALDELVGEAPGIEGASLGLHTRARLAAALASLQRAESEAEPALVAVGLREALRALGEAFGDALNEDLMGMVFSRFCIGK